MFSEKKLISKPIIPWYLQGDSDHPPPPSHVRVARGGASGTVAHYIRQVVGAETVLAQVICIWGEADE